MIDLLVLNSGVGRGQPNDEDDVASTDDALREIGAYVPPPEYAGEPQRYITAPAVDALESFQQQSGLKVDGYAKPGGPTERAINNQLLGKPRGAGLLREFDMAVGDTVGNGFANRPRDVETVKRALGGLGHLPEDPFDRPSGFIDEATTQAIRRFQENNRLEADGWLSPGGETEAALHEAVQGLERSDAPAWRRYWDRVAGPAPAAAKRGPLETTLESLPGLARRWLSGVQPERPSASDIAAAPKLATPLAEPANARWGATSTPSAESGDLGGSPASASPRPTAPVGARPNAAENRAPEADRDSGLDYDPNYNFGSWALKRTDLLPEGVTPPADPLKPDPLPRDVSGEMPIYGADGRAPPVDAGIDRKRELRFLISRLYRAGAVDEAGRHRLGDDDFERYVAAAKDHIKPEHAAIFEMTARAVRAGALDWHTAATRLAAYYAPETSGEKVVDFILDFAPIAGQVKAAKEIVEAVQDAIDARAYGDEKAFEIAIGKAAGAAAAIALPGAAAGISYALRKEAHHLITLYLGGLVDGPTVSMTAFWHRLSPNSVHSKMRRYFGEHYPKLVAKRGYPGKEIVERYSLEHRRKALDRFYRTFEHSNRPHERQVYESWITMFPESRKYFRE